MQEATRGAMRERIRAGLRPLLLLGDPVGLSRAQYEGSLWAVLLLGASLGVQGICTAMAAIGPLAEQPAPETLTEMGRLNVIASYDIPAYAASCAFAVALMVLLMGAWSLRLRRADPRDSVRVARRGALLHGGLGVLSLAAFFGVAGSLRVGLGVSPVLPPSALAWLAAPGAAALLALAVYHALGLRETGTSPK